MRLLGSAGFLVLLLAQILLPLGIALRDRARRRARPVGATA